MDRRPLERAVAIAREGTALALEGIYLAGRDAGPLGAVVAAPHPLYGGSMEHPVVSEVAHACCDAGVASLRFNWRGTGASPGQPSGEPADADADYAAAACYLEETVEGPLLAAGYSFGAAAAVRAALRDPRFRRLLLVAPPPALLDRAALLAYRRPVLIVAAARDEFAPIRELETLTAELARGSFHRVQDADHFFGVGLAEIARAVRGWL